MQFKLVLYMPSVIRGKTELMFFYVLKFKVIGHLNRELLADFKYIKLNVCPI